MMYIDVPDSEYFDARTSTFITIRGQRLKLEHSLVSISKWESKWKKPFLTKEDKTPEETRDYIRCMTITQNVDPNIYLGISNEQVNKVLAYINDPMTATWFREDPMAKRERRPITSEVIYYYMADAGIDFGCETWHLNRLMTLIRVCHEKSKSHGGGGKRGKMSSAERAALNARRRTKR